MAFLEMAASVFMALLNRRLSDKPGELIMQNLYLLETVLFVGIINWFLTDVDDLSLVNAFNTSLLKVHFVC